MGQGLFIMATFCCIGDVLKKLNFLGAGECEKKPTNIGMFFLFFFYGIHCKVQMTQITHLKKKSFCVLPYYLSLFFFNHQQSFMRIYSLEYASCIFDWYFGVYRTYRLKGYSQFRCSVGRDHTTKAYCLYYIDFVHSYVYIYMCVCFIYCYIMSL